MVRGQASLRYTLRLTPNPSTHLAEEKPYAMADYDVIVIGSGLAGLTAGLFAARYGLSTLVMESNIPGGHLISIEKIEDFPGFPDGVAGYELCPTVQRQAADQGAEFQRAEVQSLEARNRLWSVNTDEESHRAKAVIVATGSTLKNLGVPGEERLMGRGVSHCASCDGPLYNGQDRRRGRRRRLGAARSADADKFRRAASCSFIMANNFPRSTLYRQRVLDNPKIIAALSNGYRRSSRRRQSSTGVRVRDLDSSRNSQVDLAGLFIYVGLQPNTELFAKPRHAQRIGPCADGCLDENST